MRGAAPERAPPSAITSATTISVAATANVTCMPVVTSAGLAVVMSAVADAIANTAPMTEAPVMPPRLRDRLSRPETTPRRSGLDVHHHGGVVGGLEQLIARGDERERGNVARDAERHRQHAKGERAGRHCQQPRHADERGAQPIDQPAGRDAAQGGEDRAARHDEPDHSRVEPERARQIERPDHERRHRHGQHERAGREARAQHRIAEHLQPDQGRGRLRLHQHEQADPEDASQQQRQIERAEAAAPDRHGERIGREDQSKQAACPPRRSRRDRFSAARNRRAGSDRREGTSGSRAARSPGRWRASQTRRSARRQASARARCRPPTSCRAAPWRDRSSPSAPFRRPAPWRAPS